MNDTERKLREAFDDVVMPIQLKEQTLAAIQAHGVEAENVKQESADHVYEPTPREAMAHAAVPSKSKGSSCPRVPLSKQMTRRSAPPIYRTLGFALAACLALFAVGFGGFKFYVTPTAYVGFDINPSIEIGVNYFDRVVSQKPLNDDGRRLLGQVSLSGKTYDEAMAALTDNDDFLSYVDQGGYLEISVSCNNVGQSQSLTNKSDRYLESLPCEGTCQQVSSEQRKEAYSHGMGMGKYRAALSLQSLDPAVTLEECSTMSMRQLQDRIAVLSGEESSGKGEGHGGQGMGNGNGNGQGMGNGMNDEAGSGMGQGKNGGGPGSGRGQGQGQGQG